MANRVHFKLHGVGEVPAEYAARVLYCVNSAYDGLLLLDMLRTTPQGLVRKATEALSGYWTDVPMSLESPTFMDSLELHSVVLRSPGYWDFLGALNPLEALRKYLNDRHERRKDIEFRNSAEAERLNIENGLLRIKLVSDAVNTLRAAGFSADETRSIVRDLAGIPLLKLESLQDKGVISFAEIPNRAKNPVEVDT